jgi:zinc-ribbon domain
MMMDHAYLFFLLTPTDLQNTRPIRAFFLWDANIIGTNSGNRRRSRPMKCPHCGIEVRDTTVICGYCGGKIPQKKGTIPSQRGGRADTAGVAAQKAPPAKKSKDDDPESEEEEGGLSKLLEPGEQVLIGSLNISVKKFLFHAYLTNRRIFLIDTQEKKLKVTAKDIFLDTITGSIVEFSETSDPVLVLSIRAPDDEIKAMKLVFSQNGIDRSDEIDEWITLLAEQSQPTKHKKHPAQKEAEPEPEPLEEQEEGEPVTARVKKPVPITQELHPVKRPIKDHEKQPPVKRLLSLYQVPRREEPQEPAAPDVAETGPAEQPARKTLGRSPTYREIPSATKPEIQTVKKVEVQSAVKSAMKTAMQQARQPSTQPLKHPASEPQKKPRPEPQVLPAAVQQKEPSGKEQITEEEESGVPIFCQNCGKKLPPAANFCPGCGTKLGVSKASAEPPLSHQKKSLKPDGSQGEDKAEHHEKKPAVKKAPKGSDMTLLHKFLRR